MPTHLSGLSPDSSFVNFVQVFRDRYPTERPFRVECSYCGRPPGKRETCDGCGAPQTIGYMPPFVVHRGPRGSVLEEDFIWEPNKLLRLQRPDDVAPMPYSARPW